MGEFQGTTGAGLFSTIPEPLVGASLGFDFLCMSYGGQAAWARCCVGSNLWLDPSVGSVKASRPEITKLSCFDLCRVDAVLGTESRWAGPGHLMGDLDIHSLLQACCTEP